MRRPSNHTLVHKEDRTGVEYWLARDLQVLLGYTQWRSFEAVMDKAITACQNSGCEPKDHFAHARKRVDLGSGAKREVDDIALSRYACYLIAQNGDPAKEQIAFAQTRITGEHGKNNEEVGRLLVDRGIVPERLPPTEDVKKVERRLETEQKKLPKEVKRLEGPRPDKPYENNL